MTVQYSDDFDSEGVGTDPPANWSKISSHEPNGGGVSDTHANSLPNSMKVTCTNTGSGYWRGYCHAVSPAYTSSEKITVYVYMTKKQYTQVSFRASSCGYSTGTFVGSLYFKPDGYLYLYDGSLKSSGYAYPISSFVKYELSFDFTSKTYDVWADGVQIASSYAFNESSASQISEVLVMVNNTDGGTVWIDDVQFGESPPVGVGLSDISTIKNIAIKDV